MFLFSAAAAAATANPKFGSHVVCCRIPTSITVYCSIAARWRIAARRATYFAVYCSLTARCCIFARQSLVSRHTASGLAAACNTDIDRATPLSRYVTAGFTVAVGT